MANRKIHRHEKPTSAAGKPRRAPNAVDGTVSSSLKKMLSILDIFTPDTPIWSTNEIFEELGTTRSTGYRYVKGLHGAGLIRMVGNGYYVLGPRIVELDLQIRRCDPLYKAGNGSLRELVEVTGRSALLCMLFSDSVLCIRSELAPKSPENLFSRGQRRPFFFGSASKVILPYLPIHQLRNTFKNNQSTISMAGVGQTWAEFKETLARIRSDGYVLSYGEFNPGVAGLYAPVFNSENLILGSVGISWSEKKLGKVDLSPLVAAVKRAAHQITDKLAATKTGMDRPPRAVGTRVI